MTGLLKATIAATLISASALGFFYWRAHAREPKRATHRVEVLDNSGSTADEPGAFIRLAERALNEPKVTRGSILTVIALGDDRTGNEPRLVAKYGVPYSRRVLEGKGKVARRTSEIFSNLKGRLEKFPRTNRSPIFQALKRAVE